MSRSTNRCSPEGGRAGRRPVPETVARYPSRCRAVTSIAATTGCTPRTLNDRGSKAEVARGRRAGFPTEMAETSAALPAIAPKCCRRWRHRSAPRSPTPDPRATAPRAGGAPWRAPAPCHRSGHRRAIAPSDDADASSPLARGTEVTGKAVPNRSAAQRNGSGTTASHGRPVPLETLQRSGSRSASFRQPEPIARDASASEAVTHGRPRAMGRPMHPAPGLFPAVPARRTEAPAVFR